MIRRNVPDKIFVFNAVINECKQNSSESHKINLHDVAIDKLSLYECINDLYEDVFTSDKH